MRRKSLLVSRVPRSARLVPTALLVLLVALVAALAFAQPKGKDKKKPADEPPPAETEEPAAPAEPESAPPPENDIGGPPPKGAQADAGPAPSPLNPRADEYPDGGVKAAPPAEFDKLLGDIAALRARVAALTTTLFASKVRVIIETDDSDFARIQSLVVTLDDGVVYTAPAQFSAADEKIVYEHAVAPGHHVLGVTVERLDSRDRAFKTWQSSKLSVVVPESKKVEAHFILEEDSDMAEDFPSDEDGEYELNVRLRARVVED